MNLQAAALGLVGSATTLLARRVTRKMMHTENGAPRLPRAARHRAGFGMFMALAAASGVMFAIADVLMEQRRRTAEVQAQ